MSESYELEATDADQDPTCRIEGCAAEAPQSVKVP